MANVTVAYDEDCGACRWTAERLRRWDRAGRLSFVPIQTADDLLRALPAARRLDAMHAVTSEGRVFTGGAAIPVIARQLPGGVPITWLASVWPGGTDRLYRAVASRRARIGRWLGQDACAVDPSRSADTR
jgi:predicted DCC family thiol-disulfide oxidoreductase YuxK